MLPLDTIYNEDCLQGMRRMGDGTEPDHDRIERLRPDILYRILTVVAKTFDCPARLGQME